MTIWSAIRRIAVYPRMYGETGAQRVRHQLLQGLSPHVRGNRYGSGTADRGAGSIPACTGKPIQRPLRPSRRRVYPRMYGETTIGYCGEDLTEGLSPHVRGNLELARYHLQDLGSIPACTGKPPSSAAGATPGWVYPRMYGETSLKRAVWSVTGGLSPHVRGNREHAHPQRVAARSIPACTGKPSGTPSFGRCPRVYPRMYGETFDGPVKECTVKGLSPHVRGNRA